MNPNLGGSRALEKIIRFHQAAAEAKISMGHHSRMGKAWAMVSAKKEGGQRAGSRGLERQPSGPESPWGERGSRCARGLHSESEEEGC